MDEEFFNAYASVFKETQGIPGIEMNAPLATNTLVGTIGIELELEPVRGYTLPRDGHLEAYKTAKSKARWLSIEDGSLRNGGREFIVSSPITAEELPEAIDALWAVFDMSSAKIDNSNRCSTHVHINIAGKTVNQITSIIILWGTFEQLLIKWCGEERQSNHFCLGMKDSLSLVQAWDTFLSTGQTRSFADRNLRYGALNVNPIWSQGSIEFRCGPAADNKDIPKLWAAFLNNFVDYASKNYSNPEQIGHDLSERGGQRMFEDICKGDSLFYEQVTKDLVHAEINDMALAGFRNVQRLAFGHPWHDWLELINREYVPNPFAKKGGKKIQPLRFNPFPEEERDDEVEREVIPEAPPEREEGPRRGESWAAFVSRQQANRIEAEILTQTFDVQQLRQTGRVNRLRTRPIGQIRDN